MSAQFNNDTSILMPNNTANPSTGLNDRKDELEDFLLDLADPVVNERERVILTLLGRRSAYDPYPWRIRTLYALRSWFNNKRICGVRVKVFIGKAFLTGISLSIIYMILRAITTEFQQHGIMNRTATHYS